LELDALNKPLRGREERRQRPRSGSTSDRWERAASPSEGGQDDGSGDLLPQNGAKRLVPLKSGRTDALGGVHEVRGMLGHGRIFPHNPWRVLLGAVANGSENGAIWMKEGAQVCVLGRPMAAAASVISASP